MKKRFLFPLTAMAALSAFGLIGAGLGTQMIESDIKSCNARDTHACTRLLALPAPAAFSDRVTNPAFTKPLAKRIETERLAKEQQARIAADLVEARKKADAALAKQDAERKQAAAKAEADFQAEGWWEQEPGIFVRWCGGKYASCPGKESYQDYSWRAMVWCKERACGDIYARLNISQNGTVVGWTNETAYGGYGQKVVLTFGSHTRGSGRIVEFNARG